MGAGFHGGFKNTAGSKANNIPVKSSGDLRFSKKKTTGYLLNPNHPQGGAKAKFLRDVLGYEQNDARIFHKHVVDSIKGKEPSKTEQTPYGTKHTYHTELSGKNGTKVKANVVVVIQKDNGRKTCKIVTIYPDKKEKNR